MAEKLSPSGVEKPAESYKFYRYDGAYYRRPEGASGIGVREILGPKGWVPYGDEDSIKPVIFGSEIEESEIEGEAANA